MVEDVWFPKGGMYQVITSLASIAERSVAHFLFNSPVSRIDVENEQVNWQF